ncbi:MAG: dihydrofolate reductase [Pirellulaceae bacterium]|nr:dihydrofolate reductase [Pirellulaceae bacterium]
MPLSLIVAMTRGGVIGRDGGLPWRLSADLRRFKSLTMGHHLIMGRKTFASLGKLLPGRVSLVLKRPSSPYDFDALPGGRCLPHYMGQGVDAAGRLTDWLPLAFPPTLDDALQLAATDDEPFVIGGGEIYALALPRVERLYVTWVEGEIAGETRFPPLDWSDWRETSREPHVADDRNEYDYSFCIYQRLSPSPR